jgi:hypothetical protein
MVFAAAISAHGVTSLVTGTDLSREFFKSTATP